MPRRKIIPYNPALKELARKLRNNATKAERVLWHSLSGKQCFGYDFHRQKPIGNYIVDFFCQELMLAIEEYVIEFEKLDKCDTPPTPLERG
jgi:very-short-patch-repair endonuclease